MSRFLKKISVVSNPYHHLDHKGRPCGLVPIEPKSLGASLGFVGAKISRTKTRILRGDGRSKGDLRASRQDTVVDFSDDSVSVSASSYYLDALKTGALFPGDEAASQWAGLGTHMAIASALSKAKAASVIAFDLAYGKDAHKEVSAETAKEAKALDAIDEQVTATAKAASEKAATSADKTKSTSGSRKASK